MMLTGVLASDLSESVRWDSHHCGQESGVVVELK